MVMMMMCFCGGDDNYDDDDCDGNGGGGGASQRKNPGSVLGLLMCTLTQGEVQQCMSQKSGLFLATTKFTLVTG